MRPIISESDFASGGYWGHIGKSVVRSARMVRVASSHDFLTDASTTSSRTGAVPIGTYGLALVHFWTRSFRDCLLKVFHNRFVDAKSADRDQALTIIRVGELPIRLRLLAFLSLQNGYLPLGLMEVPNVDRNLEEQLLRRYLCESDETYCRRLFDEYRQLLLENRHRLPAYPAVSLLEMAQLLPSLEQARRLWS